VAKSGYFLVLLQVTHTATTVV